MKIKTKELKKFLNKVAMTGEVLINACVLDFKEDGLNINVNCETKQARAVGVLKKEAFEKYDVIGKVGVNDFSKIIKILERFGDMIIVSKEGNLLTIKGDSKTVNIEVADENLLEEDVVPPKLEFADAFEIKAIKLDDIFKDVQMNTDAEIIITTEPKLVKFTNTGKFKFMHPITSEICKGGISCKFGKPLIDALSNLDGMLSVSVGDNYPMKVIEKGENSIVTLIVAPRQEE